MKKGIGVPNKGKPGFVVKWVEPVTKRKSFGPDLDALCREWQKRLRLQDWSIEIRYAEYGELDDDNGATISWFDQKKRARILVRPDEFFKEGTVPENVEIRVIHELLHLHLWYIEGHTPMQKIAEENAISFISVALFSLKYPYYRDEYIRE